MGNSLGSGTFSSLYSVSSSRPLHNVKASFVLESDNWCGGVGVVVLCGDVVWCSVVWCGVVWGVVWCVVACGVVVLCGGVVWCGVVWWRVVLWCGVVVWCGGVVLWCSGMVW